VVLSRPKEVVIVLAVLFAAVGAPSARTQATAKTFDVTAMKFHFEPAVIEVDQGDRVVLRLHSADVKHGFRVKPYGIKTVIPKGGDVVTVEFVADKPGTFVFACSEYCGPRHSSMKGSLVVRPRGTR
jgi:heme/copper-type cytochrome/quinol oxidase subunit 2